MIKEYLSLYFTSYIYASLFLVPVVAFYIYSNIKKVDLKTRLLTHKTIVLSSLLLPLMILAYSSDFLSLQSSTSSVTNTMKSSAVSVGTQALNSAISHAAPQPAKYDFPVTQDIVFYFADIALILSFLGLLVFLFRFITQVLSLKSVKLTAQRESLENNIDLYTSDKITSPFAIGVFNKIIFLPEGMDPSNRDIVLKHELNHFKHNHQTWSFVETVLSHIFWYNPINHILRQNGYFLREMECDSKTIVEVDKFEYSRALVESAEQLSLQNNFSLLAHSWVEKDILKKRIDHILGEKKSTKRLVLNSLLYSSVALTFGFFIISGNINDAFLESEIYQKINTDHSQVMNTRNAVEINKVPEHFIQTLLVHEDEGFLDHRGVSLFSVLRASGTNLKSILSGGPKYVSGGSTITQQLAKSFLKEEKSLQRKFRELKVARVLEKKFSKNQILEMYLNRVYLGNQTWGLASGAKKYFGRSYDQLSIEQSAMLIPFLEAPAKYNMIKNPVAAKKRQQKLLKKISKI